MDFFSRFILLFIREKSKSLMILYFENYQIAFSLKTPSTPYCFSKLANDAT